jgi:hypothetical protein
MSWDRTLRRLNDFLFDQDGIGVKVKIETGYFFVLSRMAKKFWVFKPEGELFKEGLDNVSPVYLSGAHTGLRKKKWVETCLELSIPGLPVSRKLIKPRFSKVIIGQEKTIYSEPLISMRFPQAIDEFSGRALRFIYLNIDLGGD